MVMDDDPPPPSYEAARAAGAAPPSAPTTTTQEYNTNQASSSNHANNDAYYNLNTNADYSSRADGEAIAMQPLSQPPPGNATWNKTNAMVVPLHLMGEEPQWVDCPFCKKRVKTKVVKKGRALRCLTGAALCAVCCCLSILPCALHWFERWEWYCSSCNKQIAVRIQEGELKLLSDEPTQVPSRYTAAATTAPQQHGVHSGVQASTTTTAHHQQGGAISPPFPSQSQPSSPVTQRPGVVVPEVRVQPPTAVQTPVTLQGAEFESSTIQGTMTTGTAEASAHAPSQQSPITSEGDRPPGAPPVKS